MCVVLAGASVRLWKGCLPDSVAASAGEFANEDELLDDSMTAGINMCLFLSPWLTFTSNIFRMTVAVNL